jgi:hypothetical protein
MAKIQIAQIAQNADPNIDHRCQSYDGCIYNYNTTNGRECVLRRKNYFI